MTQPFIVRYQNGVYEITRGPGMKDSRLSVDRDPEGRSREYIRTLSEEKTMLPSPAPGERFYFFLEGEDGSVLTAASRGMEIAGVENFRDLGGYPAQDGRTVKWGRFFRGGPLYGLNDQERAAVAGLGLKKLFDYRTKREAEQAPDTVPAGAEHIRLCAVPREERFMQFADRDMRTHLKTIQTAADAQASYRLFAELYAAMPFDNEAFRQMLSALDDPKGVPFLQHCAAGKDRTGVGSALLLLALGVEEKIAVEDYLLSRIFREAVNSLLLQKLAREDITPAALTMTARMMTVSEDLILSALDAIRAKYASYEAFFREEYGIPPEKLAYWRQIHTR